MIFSDKQQKTIFDKYTDNTLEVFEGGVRSGKTTTLALRYARFLIQSQCQDEQHLILGYNQEQAYKLIIECDGFGLLHFFKGVAKVKDDENGKHLYLDLPNGVKKIYYKGGGKSNDFKAFRGMSLGSVLFTEIDLLHMETINEAFRRTFASSFRVHFADLNPPSPYHPIIKEVFEVQPLKWSHWIIDDNPVISEERKKEIHDILIKSPYLYKRDYLGERVIPTGLIYSMWDLEENNCEQIPADEEPIEMIFAGDGGVMDATSVHCLIITGKQEKDKRTFRIYDVGEFYYSGSETTQPLPMSKQAKDIRRFMTHFQNLYQMSYSHFFIDPACLVLRQELEAIAIPNEKADNNAHDVKGNINGIKVGIERLQNFIQDRIIKTVNVDGDKYSHYHLMKEISLYSVDDNGTPVDCYNHCLDALRYGINYFYKIYMRSYYV